MVDPWSNYIQLVTGLSNATRARARNAARSMLSQVGLDEVADDATERITRLTEEIQAASKANREMLENLITNEVERAAGRLGFARKDDLEAVRAEVAVLHTMMQLQTPDSAATTAATTPAANTPATKTPATKTPTTKAPATKAAATKSPAKKTPAKKATAAKAAGTAAKKSAAKKTPAKKTPAKKAEASVATQPETSA